MDMGWVVVEPRMWGAFWPGEHSLQHLWGCRWHAGLVINSGFAAATRLGCSWLVHWGGLSVAWSLSMC
jgi:hypothetical protein